MERGGRGSPYLACKEVDPPEQEQHVAQQQHGVPSRQFQWEEVLLEETLGSAWGPLPAAPH